MTLRLLNLIPTAQTLATNAQNVCTCHSGIFWLHFFYNRRRLRHNIHLYLHSVVSVSESHLMIQRWVIRLSQFRILPPEHLCRMKMFAVPELQSAVGRLKQESPWWEPEVLLDTCPLLRPQGDAVAAQELVGGQAGGDIWAYCTWGRRCGSLTI